jgi:hypothetical protein
MAVWSYAKCAADAGVSIRTWKRLLADGEGPPVVMTSKRGRGHEEADFQTWKRRRKRPTSSRKTGAPTTIEGEIIARS